MSLYGIVGGFVSLALIAAAAAAQPRERDVLPGNPAEPLTSCGGGPRVAAAAVNEGACDAALEINGTPTRLRCSAAAISEFAMCGRSLERGAPPRRGYLCEVRSAGGVLSLTGARLQGLGEGRVTIRARLSGDAQDVMFGDAWKGHSIQAIDEADGVTRATVGISVRNGNVYSAFAIAFTPDGTMAEQLSCEVR
jgi:hypothetical protein